MNLKVRCERDKTIFEVTPNPRKIPKRDGDTLLWIEGLELECPTCYRGYISEDGGTTFMSDRPLTILERNGLKEVPLNPKYRK